MPETKKFETNPPLIQPNGHAETYLDLSSNIFEAIRNHTKHILNTCAEKAINNANGFGIKSYLDKIPQSASDAEVIANPERIAKLYELTSEVLRCNIRLWSFTATDENVSRQAVLQNNLLDWCHRQKQEAPQTAARIITCCVDEIYDFPINKMKYYGCEIEGRDILDSNNPGIPDVRPNFKIQRQGGGVFIMAYTNKRVCEKLAGQEQLLDRRIYLNPDLEAAPLVFERLLQIANREDISLQLKMLQRAPEITSAHWKRLKGIHETEVNLRGDGIVVFVNHQDADQFLKQALVIAECNAEIFKGRHTSRIPCRIVDGIAIGDEPRVPGYSLTSHRAKILDYAAGIVIQSGKQGVEAYDLFREATRIVAKGNGVNPHNIAFNNEN